MRKNEEKKSKIEMRKKFEFEVFSISPQKLDQN